MVPRLKAIEIRAFRGIPQLEIPLEGKSLLVGGENGTGKSSIVEAFEFFFTGTVSHLEGTQGISASRHAPHVHYEGNDLAVEATFDPGDIHLTRTFATEPTPPQHLSAYFTCASRGGFILKRSQILQFIASRPADRFRALASIIGVEGLDEVELEIMRARDELAGEVQAKQEERLALLAGLSDDLGTPIASVEHALPALNSHLTQAGLPAIASLLDIQPHAEAMLRSVKSVSSVETVSHLAAALAQAQSPLFPKDLNDQLADLSGLAKPLFEERVRLELTLSDLLQIGRSLIEREQLNSCPLCLQPIDRDTLLATITQRTTTLHSLTEDATNVRKLAASLVSTIAAAAARISTLPSALAKLDNGTIPSLAILASLPIIADGPRHLNKTAALEAPLPLEDLRRGTAQAETQWGSVAREIEAEIARLGVTEEEKRLLQMVRLIGGVKDKVERLKNAAIAASTLDSMRARAQTIFECFSEAKRSKVAQIYNAIQADIRGYYSLLHPGEEHTDVALRLRPGQRASTELRMKSFGRDDEDPRALTSEGHLDSLGLCIFLAFVKSFNVDCSLVILDDVVTTIDSGHRARVCDLLLAEFTDYQMVITTHDAIWYRELAAAQRALGQEGAFLNLEIASWTLETGPRIEKFLPRVQLIEQRMRDNDKKGAGNEARQYLEWLLKRIALDTNAPVPAANWQSGMVGDLLPSVRKRLTDMVRDAAYAEQLAAAFSSLEKTVIFGNLTSHDNILADQLSLAEIDDFFQAIRALHRLVSCPSCGVCLQYVKNTREYRCLSVRCQAPLIVPTK